jgi:hypothetical protein
MKLTKFYKIESINDEERIVYGIATSEVPDNERGEMNGQLYEGDIISLDAIRAALPDYLEWANIREMHQPSAVGTVIGAEIKDGALYLTAKIIDNIAWEKVKAGVYRGFSIGGEILRAALVEIGGKLYRKIEELIFYETSLVDRPANGSAKILLWKVDKMADEESTTPAEEEDTSANTAKSKEMKTIKTLQAMRDEAELAGDSENTDKYNLAIKALMGGEAPVEEEAEEEPTEQEVYMSQRSGDLIKAEVVKIHPALSKVLHSLTEMNERLEKIEALPQAGGPVTRTTVEKTIGSTPPEQPQQQPAYTKRDFELLKQKAQTEPNPGLRLNYQAQYTQALESLIGG